MKVKGLKTLILNNNSKFDNANKSQDIILNNEYEIIKEDKSLNRSNSCYNIFTKLNLRNTKKKVFTPIIKEEEKKPLIYEIEKGIMKKTSCLFSPNKFFFGKSKITLHKYMKKVLKNNLTTKISQNNKLLSTSNYKSTIHPTSLKHTVWAKKPKIIKTKNNMKLNRNKTNFYPIFSNSKMDRHIALNKSCPNIKEEKKLYFVSDNYIKEDVQKKYSIINYNQISSSEIENKRKNSSISTMEQTKLKNRKKILNSSMNTKKEIISDISNTRKFIESNKNQKKKYNMPKYHLINNNYLIREKNNKYLPEVITNFNKNSLNTLKKENEKLFFNYISLIPIHKFSEQFRDPLNNSFDRDLEKERKKKRNINVKKRNFTSKNTFKRYGRRNK